MPNRLDVIPHVTLGGFQKDRLVRGKPLGGVSQDS
jgi:hypothetical protein